MLRSKNPFRKNKSFGGRRKGHSRNFTQSECVWLLLKQKLGVVLVKLRCINDRKITHYLFPFLTLFLSHVYFIYPPFLSFNLLLFILFCSLIFSLDGWGDWFSFNGLRDFVTFWCLSLQRVLLFCIFFFNLVCAFCQFNSVQFYRDTTVYHLLTVFGLLEGGFWL